MAILVGQFVTRKGAVELERWRRREETMRLLRWAAESAASDSESRRLTGIAVLDELVDSEMLQPEDAPLVRTVAELAYGLSAGLAKRTGREESYHRSQTSRSEEDDDGE